MENGRVVLDGDRERLKSHRDVQVVLLARPPVSDAPTATSNNIGARGDGMAELASNI
jgi:hypothetical protein